MDTSTNTDTINRVAFITGVTGQDGSYLSELLLSKGYYVYGLIRRSSTLHTTRLEKVLHHSHLKLVYGDMCDANSLSKCFRTIHLNHPNMERLEIYNLAAQSHVQVSFENPEYTCDVNGLGTVRLLEAIMASDIPSHKVRYYQASTSEMFGQNSYIPQNESSPFQPISPYAISKYFSHMMVQMYRQAYQLYACNGILFNHESSRRGDHFLTKKIVIQVKQLIQNKIECIYVGNIDSVRDWGHAQDYVEGMWRMLQQESPQDYVLGTGIFTSVRDYITTVFEKFNIPIEWSGTGLDEVAIRTDLPSRDIVVRVDPQYFRPNEVSTLCADYTKAVTELNWKPSHDLHSMVEEMIENTHV